MRRYRQRIDTITFFLFRIGFDWHLMIEAHKGRHHNAKGSGASALLGIGHWDANNVDKSYNSGVGGGGNASSESAAGHQRAPLFDWESSSSGGSSATLWTLDQQQKTTTGQGDQHQQEQRIQEVTTTLGQTAFLHCRVRYLADRRVKRNKISFFFPSF